MTKDLILLLLGFLRSLPRGDGFLRASDGACLLQSRLGQVLPVALLGQHGADLLQRPAQRYVERTTQKEDDLFFNSFNTTFAMTIKITSWYQSNEQ